MNKRILKKRLIKLFLFVIFSMIAMICNSSCQTTGRFSGIANLTVLIVDENGNAINDFNLVLQNFGNYKKGITNKNGVCVFKNVSSGNYELSGKKNGYRKLDSAEIVFLDKCDVFCFRVESGNEVFSKVEKLFDSHEYENGCELLEQLSCEKYSELYDAICFYKAYGYAANENESAAKKELQKMGRKGKSSLK